MHQKSTRARNIIYLYLSYYSTLAPKQNWNLMLKNTASYILLSKFANCRFLPMCSMCSLYLHSLVAVSRCHCNPGIEIVGQSKQIARKLLRKEVCWLQLVKLVKKRFIHLNIAYFSQIAAPTIGAARTTAEIGTKMSRVLKKHLSTNKVVLCLWVPL